MFRLHNNSTLGPLKIAGSCFLFLLFLHPFISLGQQVRLEGGCPFLKYYAAKEYRAHTQNFTAVQDKRGLMYFGNFAGLLEFDGVSWRLIQTKNQTKVSSLAIDASGRIFVGARGEVGFLKPDPAGNLRFEDITSKLNSSERNFYEVNYCYAASGGVYFISSRTILFWNGTAFKTWKTAAAILSSFLIRDELFFQEKGAGLKSLRNGQQTLVPDGETFTSAVEIRAMFTLPSGQILIATDNLGLFYLTQDGVTRVKTDADDFLAENKITCGLSLKNNFLVFGTLRKGIVVLSPDGNLIMNLDKNSGIFNECVTSLYIDKDETLWATLNDGIVEIEYPSTFGQFAQSLGLDGGVTSVIRHNGEIYATTYQGLFSFNEKISRFAPVPGILTACWSLVSTPSGLVVASSQGVFEVKDRKVRLLAEGFSLVVFRSVTDPEKIFVGQTDGLLLLLIDKTGLRSMGKLAGITQEIREIAEDKDGQLWLSGSTENIIRYDFRKQVKTGNGTSEGLPDTQGAHLNTLAGEVYVTTPTGIYQFDRSSKHFTNNNLLKQDTTAGREWILRMKEDGNKGIWTHSGDETQLCYYTKQPGNQYAREKTPFLPVSDFVAWFIYPENDGVTWFGGPEGILRYDRKVRVNYQKPFVTLIRKVLVNNDSSIFSGTFYDTANLPVTQQNGNFIPFLTSSENTLKFEYSATRYSVKGGVRYQYYLEGFDKIWSEWTKETQKEYTNLAKGSYVFRVKAMDIYGNISPEASYSFRIQTPWYQTWLAWFFYLCLVAGALILLVKWRSRQLIKDKKALENLIRERTAEVVQKKEEMEQQSLELAYKNEELERINNVVKSINAQIHFTNLLQSILEKFIIIRGVEKATAIVLEKETNTYRYKASVGWDFRPFENHEFKLNDLEEKYLQNTEEIYEDIFLKTDFSQELKAEDPTGSGNTKSMLIMVIRLEDRVDGFLLLENTVKKNAFTQQDISFISNLKQHIISAFIKTGLLEDLQKTFNELKDTQDQLVQSEKLASLGQLTAGIAHEIQNPLNFVNNFSQLSVDLAGEMREHLTKLKETIDEDTRLDMEDLLNMIESNVTKINEHGKRAESIVKGMLQHSRGRTGEFELTDINNMVAEYVNLAYHGMRAKDKSFNTAIKTELDPAIGKIYIVPQDLSRVILNIVNNSCYAVDQRAKTAEAGYRPEISVTTKKTGRNIEIRIHDNGTGIPQSVVDKIFNPFFTTKPTGKGTGLGLSMSYDIISQIHKGKLEVKTEEGAYTEFIITIPENIQR
ncbi:MAG: ATP-binding protein [Bacteroidetes bacterium]|nr:ATP-binding protein [Bacteroidota bacterium]